MMMGLGLGLTMQRGGGGFSPARQMFGAGEPGYAYRLNPSICFTDPLGITQAGPADAVALRLDESGRNNHATQPTLALRPILGRKPKRGAVNMLTYTEGGVSTYSLTNNVSDGALAGFSNALAYGDNSIARAAYKQTARISGETYTATVYIQMDDGGVPTSSDFNFAVVGDGVVFTSSLVSGAMYRITGTRTATSNASSVVTGIQKLTSQSARTFNTSGIQLELGSTATPYQRVVSQFDVTEPGQRDCWYLFYGGAANPRWMQTAAIDFTSTDKITGVVGVRKLSDAAVGTVVELSATTTTNSGSFGIFAPRLNGAANFGTHLRGSARMEYVTASSFSAPVSNVLTALYDIGQPTAELENRMRVNGVDQSLTVTDAQSGPAGTGSFGNYPIYIGARGGTSLHVNGEDYGQIVRGAATDLALLEQAERYIAENTPEVTL